MSHRWYKLDMDGYWRCPVCNVSIQAEDEPSPDRKNQVLAKGPDGIFFKTEPIGCKEIVVHRINET